MASLLLITIVCTTPRLALANETESIVLVDPTLVISAEAGWVAQAEVQVKLSPVLIEAVKRGVSLYFVSEFELRKNRWWWLDEKIFSQAKTVRLSYHAVTQQYRVAVGGLHQAAFEDLEAALSASVGMRGWRLKDAGETVDTEGLDLVKDAATLEPRIRVRLDSAQLPKPLQVNAITNRDWNLSSEWVAPKLVIQKSGAPSQ